MAVLAYTSYTSINDAKDFLAKFRTFAVAQGWTSVEYNTSQQWRSTNPYGWIAGDEDFLELYSTGYGFQPLRYRFRVDPYDAQEQTLYYCPVNPGYPAYNTGITTHPALQNCWQIAAYMGISLPASSFPGCYFFGNNKFLMAVIKVTTTTCLAFAVGTIELLPELRGTTGWLCHWPACYWGGQGYSASRWFSADTNPMCWLWPTAWNGYAVSGTTVCKAWYDGAAKTDTGVKLNVSIPANNPFSYGNFNKLNYCLVLNGFTSKRVALTSTVYGLNGTSGEWYPAGSMWDTNILYAGLSIGDTVKFGADQYIAFPNLLQSYTYGHALRIA